MGAVAHGSGQASWWARCWAQAKHGSWFGSRNTFSLSVDMAGLLQSAEPHRMPHGCRWGLLPMARAQAKRRSQLSAPIIILLPERRHDRLNPTGPHTDVGGDCHPWLGPSELAGMPPGRAKQEPRGPSDDPLPCAKPSPAPPSHPLSLPPSQINLLD